MPKESSHGELQKFLNERIVVLDGGMGTTIREYGLDETAARGQRFQAIKKDILNNSDILSITQSEVIGDIHRKFFEAGSDIASTNTFSATTLAQSEFFVDDPRETGKGSKDQAFFQKILKDKFLNDLAWEINLKSAQICRLWADRVANETGEKNM